MTSTTTTARHTAAVLLALMFAVLATLALSIGVRTISTDPTSATEFAGRCLRC